jgi:uncharacterized RDD family membrane protein YckC
MHGAPDKTLGVEEAAAREAEAPVPDTPLADAPLADAPSAGAAEAVDPQPGPDVLDLVESHIIEPVEPPRPPQEADPAAKVLRARARGAGDREPRCTSADAGGADSSVEAPGRSNSAPSPSYSRAAGSHAEAVTASAPSAPGGSARPLDLPGGEARPLSTAVEHRARPKPPVGRAYAGFWERLIAATVDATLLLLVFLLMAAGALLVVGGPGALVDPAGAAAQLEELSGLFTAFEFLVAAIYHVFFVAAAGATPGKAALGLKVVRTGGAPVGAGRAFLRFAGYALELIPGMILASTVWIMGLSISVLLAQPLLGLTFGAVGAVLLGLGYLWIAFDPRKQAWHDKLAGTIVVKP